MFTRLFTVLGVIIGLLDLSAGASPISYASPNQLYFEDFDSLPNSPENSSLGSTSWVDDVTLSHWHAITSLNAGSEGGNKRLRVTNGITTVGAIYSFGASGDFDRALGSIGSSVVGDVFWGLAFHNDTTQHLRTLTINYFGEQWRDGGSAPAQTVDFQYSLNATDIATSLFGTAVNVDALDFTSPTFGSASAIALDGNAEANRSLRSASIKAIDWAPGTDLWLRWVDINHAGNDHALAIDDFAFSADVPETSDVSALMLVMLVGLLRERRRNVVKLSAELSTTEFFR